MTLDAALRDIAVPGVIGLIMLVVGMSLTIADFRRVAVEPKPVIVGIVGQLLLLPLIALILIGVMAPPKYIGAGLILLAASPAGGLSNLYTYLGRGNTALSVTLTALSNLLCFLTLPLIATFGFAWLLDEKEAVNLPILGTIRQLFVMLLLPILGGMFIRHHKPEAAARWSPALQRLSLSLLALLVALILWIHRATLSGDLSTIIRIAAPFYLLSIAAAWALAKTTRLAAPSRFTLMMEFPAQNLGVTAVVGVMILGRTDFILFATILFLVQIPILLTAVGVRRLRLARASAPTTQG